MAGKTEQFSELHRKNMEAAMRLAQLSIENSQRIMALQSELAREMFQSGVEAAKAQSGASDPQTIMQLRTQYAQETTQRMVAAAQQIAEISNAARAEFSRLVAEQLASGSQDMTESLQTFMKSLPGQTPNMMESFQQAIATANQAFEQIAKASTAAMGSVGETVKKAAAGAKRK
ncbi:MAG: phasin family protein [Sulfuritalea sp.]|nr:phasin family protein [Sulfuritalea sp.]